MENLRLQNQLRRLRFERGEMTQQNLAEQTGVTRQTIIAVEAAKYSPSLELAFKIARALRCPLEEAFQYTSPPDNHQPTEVP